jgi:TRAP-type C4-dicarboxylate transport system substrate-binding protein
MNRRVVLGLAMLAAACALVTGSVERASAADPIKLVYHESIARGTHTLIDEWFMDEVEKRLPGRVKFDRLFGGPLGKTEDQPANLKNKVFDLGWMTSVYTPGLYPALIMTTLPFLTPDLKAANLAATELNEHPALQKEQQALNQKILYHTFSEPMELLSHKPAKNLAELKGMKIRAHGGAASAITAAGLTSVGIPMPELAQAAERRVIDALVIPVPSTARDFGYEKVMKYWVRVNFYRMQYGMAINLDTWNKLPPDVQKVMREVAREAPAKGAELWEREMAKAAATFKAAGVEEVKWSQEELDKFKAIGGTPAWDKWIADATAKGVPAKELLETFQASMAKHRK